MKNIFTLLIWSLIIGNNIVAHASELMHYIPNDSLIENKFKALFFVLMLSIVNEFWQVWATYKNFNHSFREEVLDIAIVLFTAATFAELLSLNQVYFGLTCLSSFLANIVIRKSIKNKSV